MSNSAFNVDNDGMQYYKSFFGNDLIYSGSNYFKRDIELDKIPLKDIINILDIESIMNTNVIPEDVNLFFFAVHLATSNTGEKCIFVTTDFFTVVINDKQNKLFKTNPEFNNSDKVLALDCDKFKCLFYGAYRKDTKTQFVFNCFTMEFEVRYDIETMMPILYPPHTVYSFFPTRKYTNENTCISKGLVDADCVLQRFCDKFGHININANVGNTQEMTMDGMSIGATLRIKWSKDSEDYIDLSIRGEIPNGRGINLETPKFNIKVSSITSDSKPIEFTMLRNKENNVDGFDPYYINLVGAPGFISLENGATYAMCMNQAKKDENTKINPHVTRSLFTYDHNSRTTVGYDGFLGINVDDKIYSPAVQLLDEFGNLYYFNIPNDSLIKGVKLTSNKENSTDHVIIEGCRNTHIYGKHTMIKDKANIDFVTDATINYAHESRPATNLIFYMKPDRPLRNVKVIITQYMYTFETKVDMIKEDTWYSVKIDF